MRLLIGTLSLLIGITLLAINLYGLTQSLRPEGLAPDVLRFEENDLKLSQDDFREQVKRLPSESKEEYANRLTKVIADGMAHVHWEYYDPDLFHQRVPVWENYILYLAGALTSISEFERYHFTIPEKSIERGIGLCGDASMLLSELLNREGINNSIISIPGHVMVEANYGSQKQLLDPDFGVPLQNELIFYVSNPDTLVREYENFGYYNNGELVIKREMREGNYQYWNGASHFVTKKYYFERVSYILKWALPIILIVIGLLLRKYKKGEK